MWIFSVEGFVSIVAHRDDPTRVLVRGRSRADIDKFAQRLGRKVIETPHADYPYRFTTRKTRMARLLARLVTEIDYPNFKNAVAERQGARREAVYHEVWGVVRSGVQFGPRGHASS